MTIHSLSVMTTEASMRSHVSLLILRLEWPRPRQINPLRNVECFGCLNTQQIRTNTLNRTTIPGNKRYIDVIFDLKAGEKRDTPVSGPYI